jgi:hypothetical protein
VQVSYSARAFNDRDSQVCAWQIIWVTAVTERIGRFRTTEIAAEECTANLIAQPLVVDELVDLRPEIAKPNFFINQELFEFTHNNTLVDMMATIEISNVEFLTPARIQATVDGVVATFSVSVDFVNRKVYDQDGNEWHSEVVFAFLDAANVLDDDFYAMKDDTTYDQVAKMQNEHARYAEDFAKENK